jgi:AcrR family transcriptional regulator
MGVKERRQRQRTEIRERILEAALEVFARDGAEGVTMRALADAIEYSAPVIYAHFRDKDAIIQELCHRQLRTFAGEFASYATLHPVERLRRIGYVYADFAIENPNHFRFLFLQPRSFAGTAEDVAKDDPQWNGYAFLKQAVKDGLAEGVFRPEYRDAEMIAQVLWASAHGVVALHTVKSPESWIDWRDARRSARLLVDVALNGIVKPEAMPRAARTAAPRPRARRNTR